MKRWYVVIIGVVVAVIAVVLAPPQPTLASWADAEYAASGTLTAGTVSPPTTLQCTAGLLSPPHLTWTLPVGGLTRTGFIWSLSGAFSGGGTLSAATTSLTITGGLLGIGSGTFHLVATEAGGWKSTEVTATVGELTGLIYTCSVP